MLDLRHIRREPELVRAGLLKKGDAAELDRLLALDAGYREALHELEAGRAARNSASRAIAELLREERTAEAETRKREVRALGERLAALEREVEAGRGEIETLLLGLPNLPHESVPVGADVASNRVERSWGTGGGRPAHARPHWEIGPELGLVDFERGAKVAGSGFLVFRDLGARLERALISFMIEHHRRAGFVEVSTPFLANRRTMLGTGQLPKLEADMYHLESEDLFLIPTAEVPVTGLHQDEILDEAELPIRYVSYSPCFRREAGAAGRDTRGMIRVHQFDKVELVKIVRPEASYDELESLVARAESVLQALELPYRVVLLATGDMSFASAKTYDLEVWAPGVERWLEVSSCSNFEDFQARRSNMRFRRREGDVALVHTLNGSGLALPRTLIGILENGLGPDGSVTLPAALRPYLDGLERIEPPGVRG
ncbi:MAG TPA: serine--tRNA ligase [Gemmatimonadota bacterium]